MKTYVTIGKTPGREIILYSGSSVEQAKSFNLSQGKNYLVIKVQTWVEGQHIATDERERDITTWKRVFDRERAIQNRLHQLSTEQSRLITELNAIQAQSKSLPKTVTPEEVARKALFEGVEANG